ncbi:hypothetical protein BDW69DRAFT_179270 [Aspergillus filifer]
MLTFTDEVIRMRIREELSQNADHIAFLPFTDLKLSILEDVELVKESPLISDVPVTGYIYNEFGKIVRVEQSRLGHWAAKGELASLYALC